VISKQEKVNTAKLFCTAPKSPFACFLESHKMLIIKTTEAALLSSYEIDIFKRT